MGSPSNAQSPALEPTVSVRVAQSLLHAARSVGVSQTELLRRAHVTTEQLSDLEGRLPQWVMYSLCEQAALMSHDHALGFQWGNQHDRTSFELVVQLISHAPTLRRGLESLVEFSRLITDSPGYEVIELGHHVHFRSTQPKDGPPAFRRCIAEMLIAGFVNMVRKVDERARPVRVCFDYPAPAYRDMYAQQFQGAERFDQPFSEVVYERSVLDAPSRYADSEVEVVLQSVAEARLLRLTQNTSHAARARDVLFEQALDAQPNMALVARSLGMCSRSLRHKLHCEGTSWDEIVNYVVATRAKQVLANSRLTIQEASHVLGFSRTSAFHRAFKRWTGTTPRAYRAARVAGRSDDVEALGASRQLASELVRLRRCIK